MLMGFVFLFLHWLRNASSRRIVSLWSYAATYQAEPPVRSTAALLRFALLIVTELLRGIRRVSNPGVLVAFRALSARHALGGSMLGETFVQ